MSDPLSRACLPACLLAALAAAALAQQTRLLSDFAAQDEWKLHRWNKAKGELASSAEFPPSLVTPPGVPRRSLAATVQWPGGKDFAFFNIDAAPPRHPIPFAVRSVSLWVKGPGTGHFVAVHFTDASGEVVKVGLGRMDFTDWRKLRAKVPAKARQPLTLQCISLHNWGLPEPDTVRLYLARLAVVVDPSERLLPEGAREAFDVEALSANGLVGEDGKGRVALKILSWAKGEATYEVRQRTAGWDGQGLGLETLEARVAGTWRRTVELSLPRYGPLVYTAELWEPGAEEPKAVARARLVRPVPVPRLSAAQRLHSPIGVNGHYGSPWATLGAVGIHWGRDYSWGWLKQGRTAPKAPNGVDFAKTLQAAQDAGITLLPITMRTFWDEEKKAFVEDEAAIVAAFERLSRAFPSLPYWELDNEADFASPGRELDPANYAVLIRAAARGLRAAGDAQVVLNGTAGIHYRQTLELLKSPARDDFAVVNYHFYTGTSPPELAVSDVNVGGEERRRSLSFLDQMRRINRAAHAAGKRAWLTEIGWDVRLGPAVGERLQAIYLPRVYLLARWCGTDKVFWYFDRDVEGSKTKFGSCGLIDLDGLLRPSAAALAALSRHTAQAEVAGSVDLGADRWCIVLEKPGGGWVAAAWSVKGEYPVPKELASCPAFGLFGNPLRIRRLSPEVAYFHLEELPAHWQAQRKARWLSPTSLTVARGEEVKAQAAVPEGAMAWRELPRGVTASPWEKDGERRSSTLRCGPDAQALTHPLVAAAEGHGWSREWRLSLRVRPAIVAAAEPYLARKPTELRLRAAGTRARQVRVVPPDGGTVTPAVVQVGPEEPVAVSFRAPAGAEGPLSLTFSLDGGVRETVLVRPLAIGVRRVEGIRIDGQLGDWPKASKLPRRLLTSEPRKFLPHVWLGWSPKGLWLAAKLSVVDLRSGDPRSFWDGTSVELFLDAFHESRRGWGETAHQFWFTPVKADGRWRLYAGEWKRSEAIPATIYDDDRCETGIHVDGAVVAVEAFVPRAALRGLALEGGSAWRASLVVQEAGPTERASFAWPRRKEDGLLEGSHRWGIARLRE